MYSVTRQQHQCARPTNDNGWQQRGNTTSNTSWQQTQQASRHHRNCGRLFKTAKWQSLTCEKCGFVVAKTVARAQEEREERIIMLTQQQAIEYVKKLKQQQQEHTARIQTAVQKAIERAKDQRAERLFRILQCQIETTTDINTLKATILLVAKEPPTTTINAYIDNKG